MLLTEKQLIADGNHVLVAYIMKPKSGYEYISTAAHFAAESSTGTKVSVSTTDDFTKTVDALVYEVNAEKELTKIAYPVYLFDFNMIDGCAMLASFLSLTIVNNQGMGDVEYAKMHDFYYLLSMLQGSFMSRKNTIVVPGGKMGFALEVIIEPLIINLINKGKLAWSRV